jgi:O-acetyl-ADP-ribose deacetylase (regulator of RNase III)
MTGGIADRISVIEGDITQQHVDAIVNAANTTLLGGGGVDGAIHRAAGPELLEECRVLWGCQTGEAKITKGYRLPARFVIHTLGPVWNGGQQGEDVLLASCYRKSLELAESKEVKTIAFPAISAGAYGFPLARATMIAVKTVTGHLKRSPSITKAVFVCHSERALRMYQDALAEVAGEPAKAPGKRGRDAGEADRDSSDVHAATREQIDGQLMMIEAVHGIRIVNRDLLADTLARAAGDRTQASRATAALNSWVVINNIRDEIEIPDDTIARILEQTTKK